MRPRQASSVHEGSAHRCCSLRRPARQEGRSIDWCSRRCARRRAARQPSLSLGELLLLIGDRSFGAVLVLAAGANLSPAGVIPAASTLLAVVVAFVSLQIVAGLRHIWMPRFLRRKTLSRRLVEGTGRTMKKWSRWLDPWLTRGLRPLTRRLRRARRPHLHLSGHTHSPSRIRPLSNERSDDDRRHIRAGTVGQKPVPHGARLCCEPRRRLSDLPASDVVRLAA